MTIRCHDDKLILLYYTYFYLGVFTGCMVLLALSVLTPFFRYIPKTSLSSIIIMALLRMIDFQIVKRIWQTNRIDIMPYFTTFLACFYELEISILCGVVMALVIFLYQRLVPNVEVQGEVNGVCRVEINGGLTYLGVGYCLSKVRENIKRNPRCSCLRLLYYVRVWFHRHRRHGTALSRLQISWNKACTLQRSKGFSENAWKCWFAARGFSDGTTWWTLWFIKLVKPKELALN